MEDLTQTFFYRQRQCLTVMGHSLAEDIKEPRWKQIPQILVSIIVVSAQYPLISYVIYNSNNLELATASMSIDFTNMLTTVKIVTFLMNKTMFLEIMNELKKMWLNCDRFASSRITMANVMADRMVNFYFYSCTGTGVYILFGPLVKIAWAKFFKQPIIKELPAPMKFPFDVEASPGYECAYFYICYITFAVLMHAVAIDGLFISFAIHLRSHFRLLQHYIEMNSFDKTDSETNNDICSFVKYHTTLLTLAEKVCVIVYQLVTHMGNLLMMMIYITFLVSIMIQLLIYCYGGEILKTESLMVGTAVQLCKWYRLPPKYRKMLCLLMMRSQKEVIIQAGFYEASLANFMLILKAAMSYITLIQSIE